MDTVSTLTKRGADRRSAARNSPAKARFAVGALSLGVWAILVIYRLTPVEPFVNLLHDIILGTVLYHAVMTNPKG